jgi:hypothetical protein
VAEDLHCSYWAEFDGGCYDPYSSIAFFKKLVDMTNFEHWGADVSRVSFLDGFAKKYNIEFTEDVLASIYSVEFSNSLCFIRKCAAQLVGLGKRVISGQVAEIVPIILELGGTVCPKMNQVGTVWSVSSNSIEERYFAALAAVKDMEQTLDTLRQLISKQDSALVEIHDVVTHKEVQIVGLNQAVADKEVQIVGLNQVVVDKEMQIVGLNQAVMDTNNKITQLDHEMTQYKEKMVQMWFALRS